MQKFAGSKLQLSILYVEDETITRTVFCEVMATKVRTVYQAANGREGLDMFRRCRPDVVLVDNNMPEMDGMALSKAIQAIDPATPIIVISGDIKRRNLSQMEQMKLHYIKKPIRIRGLLALLENLKNGLELPSELAARAYRIPSC